MGMAQDHQRSSAWGTKILDLLQRTYNRRWVSAQRYTNHNTWQKREEILKLIHEGHLGLNKCKMRAKETMYWLGINEQLEHLILNCQLCLKYSRSKDKNMPHTALGHEIPSVPWSKVTTDIYHFESKLYLLVVDYTTRFPIVREIKSMSAEHIAEHFRLIFSEYGWSDTLVSDNGPCYVAETFTSLMKEYAVNHITSFPPITPNLMDWQKSLSKL